MKLSVYILWVCCVVKCKCRNVKGILSYFSLLSRKEDSEKLVVTPDVQSQTLAEGNSDVHCRYSNKYL